LNRHVGRTQLAAFRLGDKPDCLCLVGVELQATGSALDVSVGRAVRQASSKRVDVTGTGVTAVIELGVISIHVGPNDMSTHQDDNIYLLDRIAFWPWQPITAMSDPLEIINVR